MSSTIENNRPNRPTRRLDESVAIRIDQLLQRVAKLTTADKLKPTTFDDAGEQHARAIAAAEQQPTDFVLPRLIGTNAGESTKQEGSL